MPAIYTNFATGTVSDNPLTNAATTLNSSALASLPAVSSPNYMWLVLDPLAIAGAPEIIKVTAHTASATSATIVRGQQGTSARQHSSGILWTQSLIANDLGGLIQSDTEANKPSAPANGYRFYATDTLREWLYDGTGWIIMREPRQTFTPSPAPFSGSFGSLGTVAGTYQRSGGFCHWDLDMTVTTNGTGAVSVLTGLPVSPDSSATWHLGIGRDAAISGKLLQCYYSSGSGIVLNFDGTYPVANGSRLLINGWYKMNSIYS